MLMMIIGIDHVVPNSKRELKSKSKSSTRNDAASSVATLQPGGPTLTSTMRVDVAETVSESLSQISNHLKQREHGPEQGLSPSNGLGCEAPTDQQSQKLSKKCKQVKTKPPTGPGLQAYKHEFTEEIDSKEKDIGKGCMQKTPQDIEALFTDVKVHARAVKEAS